MKTIELNTLYRDQFILFEPDGLNYKSGESAFTSSLWLNGSINSTFITVLESSVPGIYNVSFTPDTLGTWNLVLSSDYNNQVYADTIACVTSGNTFKYNASDNGSTFDIGIWLETNGSPMLNLDSMSATIYDNAGTGIIDLGVQTISTSAGIFRFTGSSSFLIDASSYYVSITAIQGSNTWAANLGLTTA